MQPPPRSPPIRENLLARAIGEWNAKNFIALSLQAEKFTLELESDPKAAAILGERNLRLIKTPVQNLKDIGGADRPLSGLGR